MAEGPTDPIAYYHWMFDKPPEELALVAGAKRFRERFVADAKFRDALEADPSQCDELSRRHNLPIAASALRPMWHRATAAEGKLDDYPAARAFRTWQNELLHHRSLLAIQADTGGRTPRFDGWHRRQAARVARELGKGHEAITHPVVSFELSRGCSVGCWFCGISADKFAGYWPHSEANADLWRGVLAELADVMGPAIRTGFCYWGSDPADNPDYARFVSDYHAITGWFPQMTTAAPMKNLPLTREVLRLASQHRCVISRFSLLTLRDLDAVHAEFTPEELLPVELVLHMKGSLVPKAVAGRALERKKRLQAQGQPAQLAQFEWSPGTIACVSGFLVNMPEGRIRLIAPCRPGELTPLGYHTFAEAHFKTAEEFGAIVRGMIQTHMPEGIAGDELVRFRSNLVYEPAGEHFQLREGNLTHTVHAQAFTRRLGELVAAGDRTASDIVGELVADGADVFVLGSTIDDLFELGLIEGVAATLAPLQRELARA
jgi:radical SAM family RiPP maturation amino acid epimerase